MKPYIKPHYRSPCHVDGYIRNHTRIKPHHRKGGHIKGYKR